MPYSDVKINGRSVDWVKLNGNIWWQRSAPPVVTYRPILPDDTAKYPMALMGYSIVTLPPTVAGTSLLGVDIDNSINKSVQSFCNDYPVYDVAYADLPDPGIRTGTANYPYRIYPKDTAVATTAAEWNDYLAEHDVKILVKFTDVTNNSLWFAVTDGTNYGYYCPASSEFVAVYGMTGTVIERVEYASFSGSQYVTTGYQLTGADTVEIDFEYSKSGCNVFGSWRSSNENVFTLYASTNRSYVRYGSSLYRATSIPLNDRVTYRMTPSGDYLDGVSCNTWTQLEFSTGKFAIVGWLDGSSSPKLEGDVYEFTIENHVRLLPVKIGTAYYLFDALRWEIPAHIGTLDGGTVITDAIPFPDEIPNDAPVLLMMGGNPEENYES